MKQGMGLIRRGLEPTSLGRVILSKNRARHFALWSGVLAIVSTAGLYLSIVYPAFLADDLSNPAVGRFMLSDEYKRSTRPFFSRIEQLDTPSEAWRDEGPDDFRITDTSQFGIVVSMDFRAVPRRGMNPIDKDGKPSTAVAGYRYLPPQIAVTLYPPWLILFSVFEICMAVGIAAFALHKPSIAQREYEERALEEYFGEGALDEASAISVIENVLRHFHAYATQLNRRHGTRLGIEIHDEHDVQDILDAVLRINFRNLLREEPVPNSVGAVSRIDILLPDPAIAIEVKMTRDGLRDGKLGEELLIDLARYAAHPACRYLFLFIYDPQHRVRNPNVLLTDLVQKGQGLGLPVQVIYAPPR